MNVSPLQLNTFQFQMNEKKQDVLFHYFNNMTHTNIEALKIAIEAKLKKQSVYAKSDISMSASKLSRGEGSLGKSQRKILPPLDRTTPGQSLGGTDAVFNNSNSKAMRLDTLSPVHPRFGKKLPPNTTKDPKFFITSEFLTPHYINDLPAANMEPSMISKVSPT